MRIGRILRGVAAAVGIAAAAIVILLVAVLLPGEIRHRHRLAGVPVVEKQAAENGRIVAERFRVWIAEHRECPNSDSLCQAIAFGPGEVANPLRGNQPVRYQNWAYVLGPGDLYRQDTHQDKKRGQSFTLACDTGSMCVDYMISVRNPRKVHIRRYTNSED
jgi:hypothetical protein